MAFAMNKSNIILNSFKSIRYVTLKHLHTNQILKNAAAPLQAPQFDGQHKQYSSKIVQLVDQIAQLNLLEVADLNELLRKKLNIKDVAMSYAAAAPATAAAGQTQTQKEEQEPEEAQPKSTKSSFKLKLVKYDEAKKVALIKEVKALGENMNLVQAKKFIESVPQVFRDNLAKDEAEKLKAQLEKVGATCELE